MDILINIGWGIAAAVVGIVAIVLMLVVILGPIIGGMFLWEEHGQYIFQRKFPAVWRGAQKAGPYVGFTLVIAMILTLSVIAGFELLDGSYDEFGWPPIPQWMQDFAADKD